MASIVLQDFKNQIKDSKRNEALVTGEDDYLTAGLQTFINDMKLRKPSKYDMDYREQQRQPGLDGPGGSAVKPKSESTTTSDPKGPDGLEVGHKFNMDQVNPLIMSILRAFAEHKSVSLNPNHIQFTILNSFGTFLNQVGIKGFDGTQLKQELKVINNNLANGNKTSEQYKAEWSAVLDEFVAKIQQASASSEDKQGSENPLGPVGSVINALSKTLPSATRADRMANAVALMSSVQKYFRYRVDTLCGIDTIHLLGTKQEWSDLLKMLPRGLDTRLNMWCDVVQHILQHFVDAFDGKVDKTFWRSMIKYNSGSGGDSVSGWILALFIPHLYCNSKYQGFIQERFDMISANAVSKEYLSLQSLNDQQELTRLKTKYQELVSYYKKTRPVSGTASGTASGPESGLEADCNLYWYSVKNLTDLPSGITTCPFEWNFMYETRCMKFVAGLDEEYYDNGKSSFATKTEWAVVYDDEAQKFSDSSNSQHSQGSKDLKDVKDRQDRQDRQNSLKAVAPAPASVFKAPVKSWKSCGYSGTGSLSDKYSKFMFSWGQVQVHPDGDRCYLVYSGSGYVCSVKETVKGFPLEYDPNDEDIMMMRFMPVIHFKLSY